MSAPAPASEGTWRLPPPTPFQGPTRCPTCAGAKVLPDWYPFDLAAPRRLVIQPLCPTCQGCGRAEHEGCQPGEHADHDPTDDDHDDLDADLSSGPCPSCQGRGWWPMQSFPSPPTTIIYLRVPCGCSESRLVQV